MSFNPSAGYFALRGQDAPEKSDATPLVFITQESKMLPVTSRWHKGMRLNYASQYGLRNPEPFAATTLQRLGWQEGMEALNKITLGFNPDFIGAIFGSNTAQTHVIRSLKDEHERRVTLGTAQALPRVAQGRRPPAAEIRPGVAA